MRDRRVVGDREVKRRTHTRFRFDPDFAAESFQNTFADCKAKAGPGAFAAVQASK